MAMLLRQPRQLVLETGALTLMCNMLYCALNMQGVGDAGTITVCSRQSTRVASAQKVAAPDGSVNI